ncbi:NAD kinase [Kytococcus aerolatus]|nr:NAD kinase [Kytococcus aerolatus]
MSAPSTCEPVDRSVPPLPADRRRVAVVCHPGREEAVQAAVRLIGLLQGRGFDLYAPSDQVQVLQGGGADCQPLSEDAPPELVVVLGGDGTILRGATVARQADVPLLGVNLGHVGFLAEVEREELERTVEHIVRRDYHVEWRMTLEATAFSGEEVVGRGWALNEATVEKGSRERMVELALEVEGRPLAAWGCDGIVVATPTGSTAYGFSAGGPVVWPDVEAILVVPISAHALFARPLVLGPTASVAVEVVPESAGPGVLWCDGHAVADLPAGSRVEVVRSPRPVRLARLSSLPFGERLVRKFGLSVEGWRGAAARRAQEAQDD